MATLEERLQNLTQDINPMGTMSDMDRKIAMNAMPRQQSAAIMDMVGKTNAAISNREMEMFRNAMPTNSLAPSVSTLDQKRLEQAFKEIQSLAGVLTNKEQDMLSQANDPITLLTTLRDIKQNLRSSGRLMSDTDKEIAMNAMPSNPMQPLVEMGFGEQVDIILGNPADSDISRQAQQQIINEMGTGMDIDSFLMEVNNLAPKGAMTNIDAEGIKQLMSMGRDGDTTIGHLSEGEVVIPAPVLEANPQAADMLEQTMSQMGIDPRTRVVDSTGEIGGIASINPETGFQEFGFLSKLFKKVKKLAPLAAFIPGVGPAVSGLLGSAGTAVAGALGKVPGIGGLLKAGATKLGSAYTGKLAGLPSLLARNQGDVGTTNPLIKALGDKLGFGGRSAELDNLINPATNSYYTSTEIAAMTDEEKRVAIDRGRQDQGGTTLPAVISETINPTQIPEYDKEGNLLPPTQNSNQGGMGMMGKLGIAGLAGLIGKLAYDEAKDQKGVPLTPLTQMDQLGRYNIEAEIARRTGAEAPSRVEFGLNPEGMPALSGGRPTVAEGMVYQPPEKRMMAQGGIMNLNGGGSTGFAERMEVADKLIDSLIPTRKETGAAINEDERNLLNRYSIDRAVEAVPFVPNFIENLVQSDKYKDFESATMDFITPALRHESGAAITYDEINAMKKSLIPMPGDREEVIEAKSMARKNIINKMRSMNSDTQEPNKTKVFAPQRRYDGGIMNLNMGGMPRYNYGGGVQYFNQGGAVAMAEGGDMDATINIEEFPAKDGQIDGPGTEVSDDIPAMLSDGEFVMTAKAVKGAGAFNINDNNGILTLTPNGDPSRDSGTRVMYKLMEHFGKVA